MSKPAFGKNRGAGVTGWEEIFSFVSRRAVSGARGAGGSRLSDFREVVYWLALLMYRHAPDLLPDGQIPSNLEARSHQAELDDPDAGTFRLSLPAAGDRQQPWLGA